jgi:sulfotransferase family protein
MPSTNRPIFLVGCPRSGTTLLSVMLHAHPRIAMPPETRFLLPVYRERLTFGDLSVADNRRRLAERMTGKGTRFSDLRLRRKDVIEKIVAGPPTIGSAAGTVWREFARSRGKERWGEKRPSYWRDIGLIRRLFPDAQIVHLVRDGRSCVASLKKVTWWERGVAGAMASWTMADSELRRVERRLPADSYHRLRYEDLLADPRVQLSELCRFLGEDFDDAMLDYPTAARDIVPARKSWHDRTRGGLDPDRIEAWRRSLDPVEIGLFERVARRGLERNGYPLSGAGTDPPLGSVLAYRREWARRVGVLHKERLADARLRRFHPQVLEDLG